MTTGPVTIRQRVDLRGAHSPLNMPGARPPAGIYPGARPPERPAAPPPPPPLPSGIKPVDEGHTIGSWAIVEQLGHRSVAGQLGEERIARTTFVRVHLPTAPDQPGHTVLVHPTSVYAVHLVDEPTARAYAAKHPGPTWTGPPPGTDAIGPRLGTHPHQHDYAG